MSPDGGRLPSERAMDEFIARSPGLKEPRIARAIPGMPSLPQLKALSQSRRAAGLPVIDQSAGDISDVGQPMNSDFYKFREEVRGQITGPGGKLVFPQTDGLYGFASNYQAEYPALIEELGHSWGLEETPVKGCSSVSGRAAIDFALRGLVSRLQPGQKGCIIMDPLAWSGYKPLAKELGLEIIYVPAVEGKGLSVSADGFKESLEFAKSQGLTPVGVIPIIPSNPTGESMDPEELKSLALAAAEANTPLMIDAFYSPLHTEGHRAAVPLDKLEKELPPEVLGNIGMIVGETKVTDSQKKTGTMLWLAPKGHDELATKMAAVATKRKMDTNSYARPDEALSAIALHRFPGGIHEAMGPRYQALENCRQQMKEAVGRVGLPFVIGHSFYGLVGFVDPETGMSIIRDKDGAVINDPVKATNHLVQEYGLVGVSGADFSSAPEAAMLSRLTAAVKGDVVSQLEEVLGQMLAHARRYS